MNLIFITITMFWLMEFIIFPSKDKIKEVKTNSFFIILMSILLIIIVNGFMFYFDILIVDSLGLKIVTLNIYALGLILRYYSLILLGKNFSRNVEVNKEQELISTGTYKHLRHPLYLGLFLLVISVPLYSGNLIIFLLSSIIMFRVIDMRIKEEEKTMESIIGERYIKWKSKRYKFIPFIY